MNLTSKHALERSMRRLFSNGDFSGFKAVVGSIFRVLRGVYLETEQGALPD